MEESRGEGSKVGLMGGTWLRGQKARSRGENVQGGTTSNHIEFADGIRTSLLRQDNLMAAMERCKLSLVHH